MEIAFSLRLPTEAGSVPIARGICRSSLTQLGVELGSISEILLALTEACGNVIRHAAAGRSYDVRVRIAGAACVLEVADHSGTFFDGEPVRTGEDFPEAGRGLDLIRSLVDGMDFHPQDGGTVVQLRKTLRLVEGSPLLSAAA